MRFNMAAGSIIALCNIHYLAMELGQWKQYCAASIENRGGDGKHCDNDERHYYQNVAMQTSKSILYFRLCSCIEQIGKLLNRRDDGGFFGDVAFPEQKVDEKLPFR